MTAWSIRRQYSLGLPAACQLTPAVPYTGPAASRSQCEHQTTETMYTAKNINNNWSKNCDIKPHRRGGRPPPENCPLHRRSRLPPDTWLHRHSRVNSPSSTLIGSSVCAQLMVMSNRQTHTWTDTHPDHGTSLTIGCITVLCAMHVKRA